MNAPVPQNEEQRIAALHECRVLDTLPEDQYDDITRLAAHLCGVPIAAISLVDTKRQFFKSILGLDIRQTSRDAAFCAHTILQSDPLIVPDAEADCRFADNVLVTGEPDIRFYAGAPLITSDGHALGSLCVIDRVPRQLSAEQTATLGLLARQVANQLESGRRIAMQEELLAEHERTTRELQSILALQNAILASTEHLVIATSESGIITLFNAAAERLLGYRAEELIGKITPSIFHDPAEVANRAAVLTSQLGGKIEGHEVFVAVSRIEGVDENEWTYIHRNGSRIPVTLSVTALRDVDGGITGFLGVAKDITDRRASEAALRQSEARLAEAQRIAKVGSWEFDVASGRVVWSQEMFHLIGRDAALGASDYETNLALYHPEDSAFLDTCVKRAIHCGENYELDLRHTTDDGFTRTFRTIGNVVTDSTGDVVRLVGTLTDITEQKEAQDRIEDYAVVLEYQKKQLELANQELESLATTDGLTGLKNHRTFQERLTEEIGRAARYGSPLTVVLLDVDHFKQFNDTYGHPEGDEVLRTVAHVLRRNVRDADFAARYGGEEFILILPETDCVGGLVIAERVRVALQETAWTKRSVTASFGVASIRLGSDNRDIVERADQALYRSKQNGRNRVTLADGITAGAQPVSIH